MPTRLKQDRSRKSGHLHSQNIQDMQHKPVDPVGLVTSNLRTFRNILSVNMIRFGDKLPAKLWGQIAVVIANMESVE